MAKKEENEQQKDVQNKAQAAAKEGLKGALNQKGPQGTDPSAAPTPKPGMGGQKSDKSASPTPKPKPGGGGEKNDMMKNLLKAGLDLLQGKDPSKHLNKALGGIMKDMPGAPKAGGKANMGTDSKAGDGPKSEAGKSAAPTPKPGGGKGAESKANMGKDSKAGKGPEPDAAKGPGLDSKNPAEGMLKSAKGGPKAGAGGGPDVKDIVKKGM